MKGIFCAARFDLANAVRRLSNAGDRSAVDIVLKSLFAIEFADNLVCKIYREIIDLSMDWHL